MTNLGLVLPQKLEIDPASTETYGKFIAEPFEKGYGHTVGHSLRRILLSSLDGAAVTAVRIKGAPHEFSSLKGVQEDVITLIQNLKQLRFRLHTPGPEVLTLKKKGGEAKGKRVTRAMRVFCVYDLFVARKNTGTITSPPGRPSIRVSPSTPSPSLFVGTSPSDDDDELDDEEFIGVEFWISGNVTAVSTFPLRTFMRI